MKMQVHGVEMRMATTFTTFAVAPTTVYYSRFLPTITNYIQWRYMVAGTSQIMAL